MRLLFCLKAFLAIQTAYFVCKRAYLPLPMQLGDRTGKAFLAPPKAQVGGPRESKLLEGFGTAFKREGVSFPEWGSMSPEYLAIQAATQFICPLVFGSTLTIL